MGLMGLGSESRRRGYLLGLLHFRVEVLLVGVPHLHNPQRNLESEQVWILSCVGKDWVLFCQDHVWGMPW